MLTADDFREIALSMTGAIERAHMGHPDFRATNGRIFATLDANEELGTVMLTPEEQAEVMRDRPKMFTPAAGAWGRQGCTTVRLDAADETTLRGALLLAWQRIMSKPPSRPSSKRSKARTVRSSRKR